MKLFSKKEPKQKFSDGMQSLTNSLANSRSASATNGFFDFRLSETELKAIYKTGLYSKILRMKTGAALREGSFEFDTPGEELVFNQRLLPLIKEAARYQLAFGRGVIALCSKTQRQDQPLIDGTNLNSLELRVFDDTLLSVTDYDRDLLSPRYYRPKTYMVRGVNFHWSRIIEFNYVEPIEDERHEYEFAGIPEPELIYEQLINDAVVQRSSGSILEKSSTLFYKLAGFAEKLQNKQENAVVRFFTALENLRSNYGAGIVDKDDEIQVISQQLAGFKEIDESSLRRVAMVTGIPVPYLMGENVRGLDSSGDTERQVFTDNIKDYRNDYLLTPINILMQRIGFGTVRAAESTNLSAIEQMNYEGKIIDNAFKMAQIGEDFHTYLEERDIVSTDAYDRMFGNEDA